MPKDKITVKKSKEATVYPEPMEWRINAGNFTEQFNTGDVYNGRMYSHKDNIDKAYEIQPHVVTVWPGKGNEFVSANDVDALLKKEGLRRATFIEFLAWRRFNQDLPDNGRVYCADYRSCRTSGKMLPGIARTTTYKKRTKKDNKNKKEFVLGIFFHTTQWVRGEKILAVEL